MPADKVIPAMKELLNDSNPMVVKNANWVLEKIK